MKLSFHLKGVQLRQLKLKQKDFVVLKSVEFNFHNESFYNAKNNHEN